MHRRLIASFCAAAAAASVSLLPSLALADDWGSNPCNSDDAQGAVITYLTGNASAATVGHFNFLTTKTSTFTFGSPFSAFVVPTQPTVAVSLPFTASKTATFTITGNPVGGTHPSVRMIVCEYWRMKDDPPNQSWANFRSVALQAVKRMDSIFTPAAAGTTKSLDLSPTPPAANVAANSRVLLVLMKSRGTAQAMKLDLNVDFKK